MSESSSGESSNYGRNSYSRSPPSYPVSSESPRSSESNHTSYVAPSSKPTVNKHDYTEIKNKLLLLEKAITEDFSVDEKNTFLKIYRQIIVENESEVTATPTPSFFLSKINKNEHINKDLKSKIVMKLNESIEEEKSKNSKLKYW